MFIESFDKTKLYYSKSLPSCQKKKIKGTIVFVHGGFHGNHTMLKRLYSYFLKEYIVIAPDLRGRGNSDFPKNIEDDKLENYGKDINAILKKEKTKEIYIVGVSFGGLVSLKFCLMYKERIKIKKIVLISSTYTLNKIRNKTKFVGFFYMPISELIFFLSKNMKEKRESNIDYSNITTPFFDLKYGLKNSLNNSLRTRALRYQMMKKAREFCINKEELKNIDMPLLLIYGKKDFFFNFSSQKDILENIKNSILKVFPNSGHNLYIEYPKETGKLIKNFFVK